MTAGKIIKLLRVAGGTSQGALAHALEVSQAHLSQIEKGRKVPSVQLLQSIAKELKVPVALLLVETDQAEDSPLMRTLRDLVMQTIAARMASGEIQDAD